MMTIRNIYKMLNPCVFMDNDYVDIDGLTLRCMDVIPERRGFGLDVVYKTRLAFDEYIGPFASNGEYARRLTGFIHRGAVGSGDTYEKPVVGDNIHFSSYDVFENVRKGASKTGDCLGTSQVGADLLAFKGIGVRMLLNPHHILLEVEIDGEWTPIETTAREGFDCLPEGDFEVEDISLLEAVVLNSQGVCYNEIGDYDLAIENYMVTKKLNPKYDSMYSNLGIAWGDKKRHDLAIKNHNKAIRLNADFWEAHCNRGNVWFELGKYEFAIRDYMRAIEKNGADDELYLDLGKSWNKLRHFDLALESFEKYASLSEENAERVADIINVLKI